MSDLTNKPFFDEESVRRAFELPDWPAGTEIVVYCRRSDSHETIEAVAGLMEWKIDRYVYIDDSPVASFYKQWQVMLAKRVAVDLDFKPAQLSDNVIEPPRHIKEQMRCNYPAWVNQVLGMPGKEKKIIQRNRIMILHRYMSEREFDAYQSGETMCNDTDHRENGEYTDSVGFCFFPEDPDDAIRWLRGIVDDDVCVTFDVPDGMVTKSRGTYCDNEASDNSWVAIFEDILSAMSGEKLKNAVKMEKVEYCCTEYSRDTFRLVDYKYSQVIIYQHQLKAEWERPKEQLPDGVLLKGTASSYYNIRIHHLLQQALKNTPFRNGQLTLECETPWDWYIRLPDGRYIRDADEVEVHDDGIVLINGRLFTVGFPGLEFNSGISRGDKHWLLVIGRDSRQDTFEKITGGSNRLEVPEKIFRKYEAAMREGK